MSAETLFNLGYPRPADTGELVLAVTSWLDNGALIADCARLGYLKPELLTLDPTYGRGGWWTRWRPDRLVAHDIRQDGVDFRELPELDGSVEQAVFDPPYMAPGGRKTSGLGDFNDRFGLHTAARTPAENQGLINGGVSDLYRVLADGALLLAKCMDYINGGAYFAGTHYTLTHALSVGFELVDRLEHARQPGPQSQTSQLHARRNLSTLFVLRKRSRGVLYDD